MSSGTRQFFRRHKEILWGCCQLVQRGKCGVRSHTVPFLRPEPRRSCSSTFRDLQRSLPNVEFSSNPYELDRHGRGESYHPTKRPDMVAAPKSVDDVAAIVRFCVQRKIPLIPFGVGTSVEGHVCCLKGGISLDMRFFQHMDLPNIENDDFDPIATVGAGVTRMALNKALRHTGLQFVVDPGADATIGGMVATGASGTTAVRYGTMRDNVLAVEVVVIPVTIYPHRQIIC